MAKQIVILGAGFAGLQLAHKLLKDVILKDKDTQLVLVSVSTHLYWNMAAPRGVLPDQIPEDQLFRPIKPGFAQYPASQFRLVIGKAVGLNVASSTVAIDVDGVEQTLEFDQLILATGSSLTTGLPLKHIGSSEATKSALRELQQKISAAKTIVVAGDGVTGVETVGELAHAYSGKTAIIFIVRNELALPGFLPSVRKAAENSLVQLRTKIIHNASVTEINDSGPSISLTLTNGQTLSTDVYLPLFGVRANSSFLPASLLDDNGDVKVDPTLRVSGTSNVWALGDVANVDTKQAMKLSPQVAHLVKNLDFALKGQLTSLLEYKPSPKVEAFITMGKTKGTGQLGGVKVFSWLVSYLKGRSLFIDNSEGLVNGK